jgi:hypothetical protein
MLAARGHLPGDRIECGIGMRGVLKAMPYLPLCLDLTVRERTRQKFVGGINADAIIFRASLLIPETSLLRPSVFCQTGPEKDS